MKNPINRLLLFCVFCAGSHAAFSQTADSVSGHTTFKIICGKSILSTGNPLYLLGTSNKEKGDFIRITSEDLSQLQTKWIQSIELIKPDQATLIYGTSGEHGAILVSLKKKALSKLPADLKKEFRKTD